MAKIGFIGLGNMGLPMAQNLLKAGHAVAGFDMSKVQTDALAASGGQAAANAKAAATGVEIVVTMLPAGQHVRDVYLGSDGVLASAVPGTLLIDSSTIDVESARAVADAAAKKGFPMLDAPVSGGVGGAQAGTLTFMVGGDQGAFDRAKPYFENMGKRLYYCGPSGQGLRAKLTQNLVLANLMQAFAEGLVLAVKNGVAPELMLDILDNSAAKSALISAKAPFILKRDFRTNFSTKWMHKDVGLALESAKALDLPLPLTAITQQMLQAAIAKGYGEDDFCSTIRVLEDLAGIEVKS